METKFKIIETEEYFLAVSDEDASNSYIYFTGDPTGIFKTGIKYKNGAGDYFYQDAITGMSDTYLTTISKKIIGYQPKGNAPELDLPLLPEEECCEGDGSNCNGSCCIVEDDVEKLAEEYADFSNDYIPISFGGKFNETSKRDFIAGYKAATKVYSEEDLRKVFEHGIMFKEESISTCKEAVDVEFTCLIRSLKQSKTPKWFVAEMTVVSDEIDHIYSGNIRYGLKTITINNKTYLVGTYSN
jgi:hypothetical protein